MDVDTPIIIDEPAKAEEVSTNIPIDLDPPKNAASNKQNKNLQQALMQVTAKLIEVDNLKKRLSDQLSNSQNNVKISIEKPVFASSQSFHPLNFIENLLAYLEKLPQNRRTIGTIVDCLECDALNWATIFRPRWSKVDDFVKDFLEQYWGREEQSLLKKEILNGQWVGNQETMCRHFTCLISQAKWLTNKMADDELVYEIMHHYPKPVQVAWYVSNKRTILEATEFLKKMDEIEVMCKGRKKIKQRTQMRKKYMLNCNKDTRNDYEATDCKKFKPQEL